MQVLDFQSESAGNLEKVIWTFFVAWGNLVVCCPTESGLSGMQPREKGLIGGSHHPIGPTCCPMETQKIQ